jgi:hypothetical protein
MYETKMFDDFDGYQNEEQARRADTKRELKELLT